MEDWFTMASPSDTRPSRGITLPVRMTMRSPARTASMGVSTSAPPVCSQTWSTCRDMAPARSATDFLWVHSSRISPSRSMNITDPAVAKSPRAMDTVTAVASSTATDRRPCHRAESPSRMYFTDRMTASAVVTGAGRNSREMIRRATVMVSLSSNSRFRAREVCSGTRSMASARGKEKAAREAMTSPRPQAKQTTASRVRS